MHAVSAGYRPGGVRFPHAPGGVSAWFGDVSRGKVEPWFAAGSHARTPAPARSPASPCSTASTRSSAAQAARTSGSRCRTPRTSSRSSRRSGSTSSAVSRRAFEAIPYRARAARAALRPAPLRRDRSRARVDPPAPSRPVPDRPHDVRRRDGAGARRLRLLPRRAAAPRRARLLGHGHQLDRPRPELRPARGALQPVRRRPEPPLRLRADRRCRPGGNRLSGAGCGSSARSTRPRCS